ITLILVYLKRKTRAKKIDLDGEQVA
ncbi:MAG: hypothetical protein RLZZ98_867, partial [Pseudomonadota bacterium]